VTKSKFQSPKDVIFAIVKESLM